MPPSIIDEDLDSAPDPAEVAARRIGQVFAEKWRIERILGAGGMATVYAATHINNQRAVALKVLHAEFSASGDIKKRFLREGFIANRIGHPGAVAILDDGVDDAGNIFLVMELLTGASLADRIRAAKAKGKRAFEQAEAMRIADGVLDVLAAAHQQGIVHRDLKPDNVFVTEVGAVKVLDFGISRLREPQSGDAADSDENKTQTRTGVLLGTPQYMPPEQARGRSNLVDERSDIWAVGAIVFAMLTGHHVHEAETPNEALLKAMTAKARPLGSLLPDVDPKVAAVVDRALSFEKEDRYENAPAMQTEVRAAMTVVGGAELAPISGGSAGNKPVTAVTRSAVPIVRDANGGRSGGWRILSVVVAIGLLAFAAREIIEYFAPKLHASPNERARVIDAMTPVIVPVASLTPPAADAAASSSPPSRAAVEPPPLAATDAGADNDAEAEDEDDDGGDDEEELETLPPAAGHGGKVVVAPHHPGAPPHKGEATPHKKTKKKKKKR